MATVLVTGATGVLGSVMVEKLEGAGYTVRMMSRKGTPPERRAGREWAQADLRTGQGLEEAVAGADVIVHCATSPYSGTRKVDVEGTRRLLEHARAAGVSHVIYPSIVGIDNMPLAYYRHKLEAERIVRESGVPWSVQRASQFHNLIDMFLRPQAGMPVMFLPTDFRFQPVEVGEVAGRLLERVAAGPGGDLQDMGGPEVLSLGELARIWLRARRQRKRIVHLPLPGRLAQGFRRGYLTAPDHRDGVLTWAEWVQHRYGRSRSLSSTGYAAGKGVP